MAVPPKQKTRRFKAVVPPQSQTLSTPGELPRGSHASWLHGLARTRSRFAQESRDGLDETEGT
jgi:hypothetical protein